MPARPTDRIPVARRRLAPEERRAELLEIAGELFLSHGSAFTAAQLAAEAGVSEGTVFRYFPDMASLISAARRQALGLKTLLPQFREALELPEINARLEAAGRAITVRMIQTIRLIEETSAPATRPQSDEVTEVLEALAPLFKVNGHGGSRSSDVSDDERALQLSALFMGMFMSNSVLSRATSAPPLSIEEMVQIFVRGAMADEPTTSEPTISEPTRPN
ncbi:MAG TPA: TetR/AcrR family transcriptional regulator [Microthrixaceae bacterium]|nr:TetR/AcrR family transcriptional regulator [Microthrixaceae bacterium]